MKCTIYQRIYVDVLQTAARVMCNNATTMMPLVYN